MNSLMNRWQIISSSLDQRSTRERALVMAALLGIVWCAFDLAWLGPHNKALAALEASNLEQSRKRVELTEHLKLQRQQVQADVNEQTIVKKQQLLKDLAAQQEVLTAGGRNMLSPEEVVGLLQRLLQARSGLQTVSLKNLKPEPAIADPGPESNASPAPTATTQATAAAYSSAQPAQAPVLWRHSVELRMRGNYGDIVSYLQLLEAQQPRLRWQSLRLDNDKDTGVGAAHTITATLVISTMSLEPQWLAF